MHIREQLLGFVLGALDDAELRTVERQLQENPQLEQELAEIRRSLKPLESDHDVPPPPGLAARTCALLDVVGERRAVAEAASPAPATVTPASITPATVTPATVTPAATVERAVPQRTWHLSDVLVVGGLTAALAILFFPAISMSRYDARRLACEENLRRIGGALTAYSDSQPGRSFPAIPPSGKLAFAGLTAVKLVDSRWVQPHQLICPASPLAEQQTTWSVPSQEQIERALGAELAAMKQQAGGSYGYNLGVVVDGEHQAARNAGRSHFALVSDAPSWEQPTRVTTNHAGLGQNVLFEDGHVRFIAESELPGSLDDPFRNRFGQVEAGADQHDAVLGESGAPPFRQILRLRPAQP